MPRIEPVPWNNLSAEQRRVIEDSRATGMSKTSVAAQVLAYSGPVFNSMKAGYRAVFRQGVIEPRLQELLRLRTAPGNPSGPCSASRKEESVGDADVACMLDPALHGLSRRERLALAFFDRLNNDY